MPHSSDALVIPAEWLPHKALWTAWPSHFDLWLNDLAGARAEVAAMIAALVPGESVKVLVCGSEAAASAQDLLGHQAEIIPARFGDIWLRDTGPVFAKSGSETVALRFIHNGWGGKYVLPHDAAVGDFVAAAAGVDARAADFVLEGGAVEHNGAGAILTTRQCLLNPNRNSGWTQATAETRLNQAFNCSRVLWLENGLLNDHTDGHVDNLARFVAADTVICQTPSGTDDPNATMYLTIEQELQAMGLTVRTIPSPGRVSNADGEALPASHMNFVVGNTAVVVPTYNRELGDQAVSALQGFFPGRNVVGVPSQHLLSGGGSFHCITQQEPV